MDDLESSGDYSHFSYMWFKSFQNLLLFRIVTHTHGSDFADVTRFNFIIVLGGYFAIRTNDG